MIEIRDSVTSDINALISDLRPEELREATGLGEDPHKLLYRAYRGAIYKKTGLVDGKVAAMWGVNGVLFGTHGTPYFVTGHAAKEVPPIKFARLYKSEFKIIQNLFPILTQNVDTEYTGAIKLMKMVGFKEELPTITGLNGVNYHRMVYTQPQGITMQLENLFDIVTDIAELSEAHGEEFTYHKDVKGEVNPNWDLAAMLDQHDKLKVVTVRDNQRLIGYFVFTIQPMAHYRHILMASEDTFYLAPEYRGRTLGYKFIKYAVSEMKKTGAKVLRVANKANADYKSMWERLGFEQEEIVYTQVII